MKKIATIITTYNRPQMLKRAINSVLQQTYKDIEVRVYDNGEDEETWDIMQTFLQQDSRVIYHRHPHNIGMMGNYKYAFDDLDVDLFSFLSDDDFLLPWFYETAIEQLETYPDAAFAACGTYFIDKQDKVVYYLIDNWPKEGLYTPPESATEMVNGKNRFFAPIGILFNRQIIKDIQPDLRPEIQLWWDPNYLMQIALKHPFVLTKKGCVVYSIHEAGYAYSHYEEMLVNNKKLEAYLKAIYCLCNNIKKTPSVSRELKQTIIKKFCAIRSEELIMYLYAFQGLGRNKEVYRFSLLFMYYLGWDTALVRLLKNLSYRLSEHYMRLTLSKIKRGILFMLPGKMRTFLKSFKKQAIPQQNESEMTPSSQLNVEGENKYENIEKEIKQYSQVFSN